MSLIIPGGELKKRIDTIAAGVAEKPHLLPKLVALKKEEFAFLLETNEFHPYFLSTLHECKQNPQARQQQQQQQQQQQAAAQGTTTASASAAAAAEAPKPMTLLEKAIADARSHSVTQDPHPERFTVPMSGPNAVIPASEMEIMRLAALYSAKVGDDFWEAAVAKFGNHSRDLDFLKPDHPRHRCYAALRSATTLVLERPANIIAELERDCSEDWLESVLDVCNAKKAFALAEAARRKASLLSEPELRAKLLWSEFSVLGRFSRQDLGLSAAPTAGASKTAVTATEGAPGAASVPIIDNYQVAGRAVTAAGIAFRDQNGVTVAAEAANEVIKAQLVAASSFEERERNEKRLRAPTGLADDEELQRNLLARFNRGQDMGPAGIQHGPQV